jgi:hypothetical protein
VIEQAPAWGEGSQHGVVAEGAVGARSLGRFRLFRYEVRRWREGVIPDIAEAVESPRRLSEEPHVAQRLLELVPQVPTPVWGRDELGAGEMWNSNSTISWLLPGPGSTSSRSHSPTVAGPRAGTPESQSRVASERSPVRAPCQPRGAASRHSTTGHHVAGQRRYEMRLKTLALAATGAAFLYQKLSAQLVPRLAGRNH